MSDSEHYCVYMWLLALVEQITCLNMFKPINLVLQNQLTSSMYEKEVCSVL